MLNDARGFSRIVVACGKTDLRKGIDGLAAIVEGRLRLNPGEKNVLFLFCGTRPDRIKGLVFEGDGYLLLYKRLDNGRFRWPRNEQEAMNITQEQFDWLMKGMTIVSTIRQTNPKRLC
ncbi:MAG: IS66 family insertion sequence element accessory protein TnpB [Abditibacteriota bacterium]|nr:IS66 family insertion sequence element accessory protein TnpB [Abditibacteriota bacterium]